MIEKHFTQQFDMVPKIGISAQAISFNVPDWTGTWLLPSATAFSSHLAWLWPQFPQLPLRKSLAVVSISSNNGQPSRARLKAMWFGENGQELASFGNEMVQDISNYNPHQMTQDVTNIMQGYDGHPYPLHLGIEVKGSGLLFAGALLCSYIVNDYADEIAALEARVAALEGAP